MNQKKLIVNGDDFGQSEGINQGIIKCFQQGILTSTSLMVRYPFAAQAAAFANNNSLLGVGLHVDLGEWIYKDGEWLSIYEVVPINNELLVEMEIKNQIELFFRIMGKAPTHLDSHQHVHQKSGVSPFLKQIAENLNIVLRGFDQKVTYCGDFYGQMPDGSDNFQAISIKGLTDILQNLKNEVTEMACHPSCGDDINTMYRKARNIEVETLCDPAIKQVIADEGIQLCSFNDFNLHE